MRPTPLVCCALTVLLSGCSLAPRYEPPEPAQVSAFKEAGDWLPAQPADASLRDAWWQGFGDAKLNALEEQLNSANPDLQAAIALLRREDFGLDLQFINFRD